MIPIVTPANNDLGVVVGISPTAIFEQAMEAGAITPGSCFLIEISTDEGETLDDYIAGANAIADVDIAAPCSFSTITFV